MKRFLLISAIAVLTPVLANAQSSGNFSYGTSPDLFRGSIVGSAFGAESGAGARSGSALGHHQPGQTNSHFDRAGESGVVL